MTETDPKHPAAADAAPDAAPDATPDSAPESGARRPLIGATGVEMTDEEIALIPTEFHPNRFKLFLGAASLGFVVIFVGWTWAQNGAAGLLTPVLCLVVIGIAAMLAREGADPRPVLTVTPEGLEDRRHGFIPWSDVALYEAKNSILAKYFGYTLRKGAQLPRNGWIYRLQGLMNALGGRPRRIWMKHMLPLGVDLMALSCRRYAPEKEKQG